MKQPIFLFVFLSTCLVVSGFNDGPASPELFNYNPLANSAAVVISGNARFTILTSQVIRMEYKNESSFEDRPTLAIVNRNLPVPQFTQSSTTTVLSIQTEDLLLSYTIGEPFSSKTLVVKSTNGSSAFSSWMPGMRNDGNLLGTIKSLDELGVQTLNCTLCANQKVHDESLHCEWGLISRDGWSIVDDTDNWALTPGAEWWDSKNTAVADWYIFGHGHNYKQALSDFVAIGGRIPIVPRYATGIWWTRWFDFNNWDVKKIVADYESRSLPLDVFVLDMDWHKKKTIGAAILLTRTYSPTRRPP